MPRPKSELTKSGRAVGLRLTEWEYQEWRKLGATKWLRGLLKASRQETVQSMMKSTPSMDGTHSNG